MKTMLLMGMLDWRSRWAQMIGPIVLVLRWKAKEAKESSVALLGYCSTPALRITWSILRFGVFVSWFTNVCFIHRQGYMKPLLKAWIDCVRLCYPRWQRRN